MDSSTQNLERTERGSALFVLYTYRSGDLAEIRNVREVNVATGQKELSANVASIRGYVIVAVKAEKSKVKSVTR